MLDVARPRGPMRRRAAPTNHYLLSCPEVLEERPCWSGFMVRDHCNLQLRGALEIWALHVMRYARRDQLSINVAFRAAGIQPLPLPIDCLESEFHSWPHSHGRNRNRGERNHAVSMMPPPRTLASH
jgi:hypothetical protein